jgi:hypothetical protein
VPTASLTTFRGFKTPQNLVQQISCQETTQKQDNNNIMRNQADKNCAIPTTNQLSAV